MRQSFVDLLLEVEGGEELIVNLAEGVNDDTISRQLVRAFATACIDRLDTLRADGPVDPTAARNTINYVVFEPPNGEDGEPIRFQYAARRRTPTPGTVETYLTWQKLLSLIPPGSELAGVISDEIRLNAFASTDLRFLDPGDMAAVAELINEFGPTTPGFNVSTISGAGTPLPIWITTAADAERVHVAERERLATRIRDWLGLGFATEGVPFFAFASRIPLDEPATGGHLSRPTVFDAIDHGWFKHRTEHVCEYRWGRSLDFEAARRGDSDCDGAPEAVAPGPPFGTLFECRYVGRLMSPPMPTQPFVLQALLGGASDKDAEIARLKNVLLAALEERP